ncbi:EscU/YscU/HrcU family type III secretion system export apparatus switch protein [Ramlibacter sp.]|uniref:EscU/YscU/HrcU family type III secretion system export apparatus switch protein n=1 Tax=Ramlibacter sp. TaxID=1917967 RepID=UPI003D109DFA
MSESEASREDRQLPASQRRLEQAREEGRVPRSRELTHLAAALALLAIVTGAGPWLARQSLTIVAGALRFDRTAAFDAAQMTPRLAFFASEALKLIVPLGAAAALCFAATSLAIGGWNVAGQALEPKFSRVDPFSGLVRIVSPRQWLEHARLVVAAGAMLGAAGWHIVEHAADVDTIARMPLAAALDAGFAWIAAGLALLAGVCFLSALADVPLQLWRYFSELRMTHEEARKEHKESDGDPHLKGERRRRARELSRGRMLADVPTASVVITNPTHYAVALAYDDATMGAPRVVAMGTDHLALKIREVAAASRVPVLEAPPLARALYRHGDVGAEVPVELYTAVAQVLAWVMRLRDARRAPPPPAIEVPPGLDPKEAGA